MPDIKLLDVFLSSDDAHPDSMGISDLDGFLTGIAVLLACRTSVAVRCMRYVWEDVQMVKAKKSKESKTERQGPATSSAQFDDYHVPELAENMEHTLRRLVQEKEQKRAKNPGLYL